MEINYHLLLHASPSKQSEQKQITPLNKNQRNYFASSPSLLKTLRADEGKNVLLRTENHLFSNIPQDVSEHT